MTENQQVRIFTPFLILLIVNVTCSGLFHLLSHTPLTESTDSANTLAASILYALICIGIFLFLMDRQDLRVPRPLSLLKTVLLAVCFYVLVTGILHVLSRLFPGFMDYYNQSMSSYGLGQYPLAWLYAILLAPVCEELCFRGLTQPRALKLMPSFRANLLQALLFALIHTSLLQMLYAFFLGLILGCIARRYNSVTYSLLFHITFNFMNLPMLFLMNALGS